MKTEEILNMINSVCRTNYNHDNLGSAIITLISDIVCTSLNQMLINFVEEFKSSGLVHFSIDGVNDDSKTSLQIKPILKSSYYNNDISICTGSLELLMINVKYRFSYMNDSNLIKLGPYFKYFYRTDTAQLYDAMDEFFQEIEKSAISYTNDLAKDFFKNLFLELDSKRNPTFDYIIPPDSFSGSLQDWKEQIKYDKMYS